jgi:hypothetical protein
VKPSTRSFQGKLNPWAAKLKFLAFLSCFWHVKSVFAPPSQSTEAPRLELQIRWRKLFVCIGVSLFSMVAQAMLPAGPLDNWHWRNPVPTGNHLFNIIYGGGIFVAAGFTEILTSSNATNWTIRTTFGGGEITGLAFGNGRFVAGHGNAGVLVSSNGFDWDLKTTGQGAISFGCVAFGNGLFCSPGSSNAPGFWRSADGETWRFAAVPGLPSIFGITCGAGIFVAVGYESNAEGLNETRIFTSVDCIQWTQQNLVANSVLRSVTWGNGRFVAVGAPLRGLQGKNNLIVISSNGVDWEMQDYPEERDLSGVTWADGVYIAVGSPYGSVLRSTDAINWTAEDPDVVGGLYAVTSGNGLFVAAGTSGAIRTSSTGIDWGAQEQGIYMGINGITCSSNLLVAFGGRYDLFQSTVLTSSNGSDWKASSTGQGTVLEHMIFAQNKFIGVGSQDSWEAGILTSSNGLDWTFWLPDDASDLYGIAYGNNLFVAVGADRQTDLNVTYSYTSSDAENWQEHKLAIPGGMPYDLAYGNGLFVAVGDEDLGIMTSTNGVGWEVRHFFDSGPFLGVAYGNGRFVAVSEYGRIYCSFEGRSWLLATNVDFTISGVTYGNGIFLAVGSAMWTSSDGIAWVQHNPPSYQFRGVTFYNHSFFAAGGFGDILQSGTIQPQQFPFSLGLRIGAFPELVLSGASNRAFRIEYKTSLAQGVPWQVLSIIYPLSDPFVWEDQRMPVSPSQFYRVLRLP